MEYLQAHGLSKGTPDWTEYIRTHLWLIAGTNGSSLLLFDAGQRGIIPRSFLHAASYRGGEPARQNRCNSPRVRINQRFRSSKVLHLCFSHDESGQVEPLL